MTAIYPSNLKAWKNANKPRKWGWITFADCGMKCKEKSREEHRKSREEPRKSREDQRKSREDRRKSREESRKSREDPRKSREEQRKSREDQRKSVKSFILCKFHFNVFNLFICYSIYNQN